MVKFVQWLKWVTASLAIALLCGACSTHSESSPAASIGKLEMPLLTTANGATYRLVNVQGYINGGPNNYYNYVYESNPDETTLAVDLPVGNYSIYLNSWSLQRADADGVFQPVVAQMESYYSQYFTIYNGTSTTVSFSFMTDGIIVVVGSGHLNIVAHVDVADAACTPLGNDCPSGSWCPPSGLTGNDLSCQTSGSTSLGQPCQSPSECVANASCVANAGEPVCVALCSRSEFGQPCASGGTCTRLAADFGFCDGSDAGALDSGP
jgi:hypothetical protein